MTSEAERGELTYRRVHHAPREVLFDCMTQPAHLTRFWGPARGPVTPRGRLTRSHRPAMTKGESMDKARSSDGTETAFDRLGDGPPVILVSGASCARGIHGELTELLAADLAIAPTLAYDAAVMGDSTMPPDLASSVKVPTLILTGSNSGAWAGNAAQALTSTLPDSQHRTPGRPRPQRGLGRPRPSADSILPPPSVTTGRLAAYSCPPSTASRSSRNAPTSRGVVQWAFRPLGLGTTQSRASARDSGCGPVLARGRPNAAR